MRQITDDQLPFAVSHAVNKALIESKEEVVRSMGTHIEGGATRWTEQGMAFDFSRKDDLRGRLYFKSNRFYMREIIEGRLKPARNKRLPEPVMSNAPPLDQRGNWPRNFQSTLIRQYKAGRGKKIGGRRSSMSRQYFAGEVGPNKTFGIWRRTLDGVQLVTSYRRSSRDQRKTFPAREIARSKFVENYRNQIPKSINFALNTAR